jgi:type II secretion system protein G
MGTLRSSEKTSGVKERGPAMNASGRIFRGFTLIELLIVVAIIAILAAIAVPNFLEAQIRSKVSRVQTDLRTIATALEAFRTDHRSYPKDPFLEYINPDPLHNHRPYQTPPALTTPIAYLTSLPTDPFKGPDVVKWPDIPFPPRKDSYDYYAIMPPTPSQGKCPVPPYPAHLDNIFVICAHDPATLPAPPHNNVGALKKYGHWVLMSVGPDRQFWIAKDDFNQEKESSNKLVWPAHKPWGYSFDVPYDATNGTKSFGNIIRTQKKPDGALPFFDE